MGFLAETVAATRRAIRDPHYLEGVAAGRGRAGASLRAAIERDRERGALLVEYKRVSPGSSVPDLPVRSVEEFVRSVRDADPTGFSCIASVPHFRGSPADVAVLRRSTDRPILFKEFVIDPIQLDAAERAGASAVLLIARLGGNAPGAVPLASLARDAHARGLEVLLEFHARAELNRADDVEADMYGVNVRDLESLRIEREEAESTLRAAQRLRPLLGLSGIEGPREAGRFWQLGVDGILVGTAVARSPDPISFLRSLRRPIAGGSA